MVVRSEGPSTLWGSSQLCESSFGESGLGCDCRHRVVVRPKGTTSFRSPAKLGKPTWCQKGERVEVNRVTWMRGRGWEGRSLSSVRERTSISCHLCTRKEMHT